MVEQIWPLQQIEMRETRLLSKDYCFEEARRIIFAMPEIEGVYKGEPLLIMPPPREGNL